MAVILPRIGVTSCTRAISLLKNHHQNIVGSFWLMCGYGFDTENIPNWWIDIVLKENQAQAIIEAFEEGYIEPDHKDPLYLGFCIIVVADQSNPASISYVIQHLRMWEKEGIALLRIMAQHNIPAHTEVSYPENFLDTRYRNSSETYEHLKGDLIYWDAQVWEDYCSYLLAEHGSSMLFKYWNIQRETL